MIKAQFFNQARLKLLFSYPYSFKEIILPNIKGP